MAWRSRQAVSLPPQGDHGPLGGGHHEQAALCRALLTCTGKRATKGSPGPGPNCPMKGQWQSSADQTVSAVARDASLCTGVPRLRPRGATVRRDQSVPVTLSPILQPHLSHLTPDPLAPQAPRSLSRLAMGQGPPRPDGVGTAAMEEGPGCQPCPGVGWLPCPCQFPPCVWSGRPVTAAQAGGH